MLEGRATIQRDLNKLEEVVNRNFIKLNKDKCKASCVWEGKNPIQHYSCRLDRQQLCRKGLGDSADSKLNISQQCSLKAMKTNRSLSCISKSINSTSRELIIPFCLALVRPHLERHTVLGHAAQEVLANRSTSRGRPLK